MRYNVGESILAVHFTLAGQDKMLKKFFNQPFLYDHTDKIESISILKLTVKEHHKVHWEYDPEDSEKKYDGFILTDSKGRHFNNQYPKADYGQLDDSADGNFNLDFPNNWESKDFENSKDPVQYYDLRRFMCNLDRYLKNYKPETKGLEHIKSTLRYNSIKDLYAQLTELIKVRHGLKPVAVPAFKKHPEITRIVFEPISEQKVTANV